MQTLRRFAVFLIALALSLPATTTVASAQSVHVTVDGRALTFDQPPLMVGGRVLVPLRGIFESLGANVSYNAASRSISAARGATAVQLALGSSQASVNGSPVAMDVPAQTIGGRTMVPLRFVSEALGADVRWNAAAQTVAITSPNMPTGSMPPNATPPAPVAQMPQISGVVVSGRNLHPGDTLRVTMTGTPGGSATFDVEGVQSGVLMREITAGQYRGEFPVDEGMSARRANVVVHLQANGLEAQRQAEQTVTMGPARPTGGPLPGGGPVGISLAPNGPWYAGQTLTVTASGVPGAYATMSVGPNQGIPMQQTSPGTYIGLYTLSPGDNTPMPVSVTFRLPNGGVTSMTAPQPVGIGLGSAGLPYPPVGTYPYPGGVFINVTSPPSGQHITGDFTLIGTTVPYAMVQVQGTVQRPLIPGVIGIPTRQVSAGGQADANGNFSIPLRVGPVPNRGTLTLQAQSTDPGGRTSQWQQFQFATGP